MILVGALVIGAIAAFVLFQYVNGLKDEVYEGARKVDAYRVQTQIKRGTPGDEALTTQQIVQQQIPQDFVPSTAITTGDEIKNKVAAFDLAPGTVVVRDMFVDQSQTTITFRQRLKNKDHVAMSFAVDDVRSVGGFLVAGDEVNMMINQQIENEAGENDPCVIDETQARQGGGTICTLTPARMLYQKVQILAVGNTTALEPGEEAAAPEGKQTKTNTGLITINVPPEASLWIASQNGGAGVYLALVAEDYEPEAVPPVPAITDKLPGEDENKLTPYGPDGNTE